MRIVMGMIILGGGMLCAQQTSQPPAMAQSQAAPGCAQAPSVAEVHKMMDLAGSKKVMQSVMASTVPQLFDSFKKMRPDVPPQVWDRVLASFTSEKTTDGMLEAIVPIYQRHFCAEDMEQIIVFYESPAGRKLSTEMPAIQQEAAAAGQAYVEHMSAEISQDVQDELSKSGTTVGTPPKAPDK
jgi:uncharacterized protein